MDEKWIIDLISKAQADIANRLMLVMPDNTRDLISDGYHTFGELYQHRNMLFIALCNNLADHGSLPILQPWKAKKHHDGTGYTDFFLAGFEFGGKQISYHLPNDLWGILDAEERELAPEWDGHSSNDVVQRLKDWFGVDKEQT